MKIIVDPRNNILYSSFYIKGLWDRYGGGNVSFSLKPFKDIPGNRKSWCTYDQYMAYVIKDGKSVKRVIIDYWDCIPINKEAYEWCDVYAKINISKDTKMEDYPKLLSIPAGYGIRIWSFPKTIFHFVSNVFKSHFHFLNGLKIFLYAYLVQLKRFTLEEYLSPVERKDRYVFHASTLWMHDTSLTGADQHRAVFIRTCRQIPNINFEGELICKITPVPKEFEDVVSNRRYSMNEYMEKTKQSMFVFNSPAVHNCHGWKFGEYLTMGKALITTPIVNRLPFAFEDGENCIIVHNQDELVVAIKRLCEDEALRKGLEQSSMKLFEEYVCPVKVIDAIERKLGSLK